MSDTTIPAPLNALVDVVNDGDTEGFLALLTDEAVIDDNGTRYAGKAAIKTWSDRELIGANGVWTVDAVEEHGDKIHLISGWKSDYYTGPGRFVFTLTWCLWGERIPYPSPASPPQWLINARKKDANVWRHISRHQWRQSQEKSRLAYPSMLRSLNASKKLL